MYSIAFERIESMFQILGQFDLDTAHSHAHRLTRLKLRITQRTDNVIVAQVTIKGPLQ